MPKRKTMPELREILIRIRRGQSLRGISRETGTHRKIVREMRELARLQGWLTDDIPLPSEGMLVQALDAHTAERNELIPLTGIEMKLRAGLRTNIRMW